MSTTTKFCACCCSSGKQCFQPWYTTYSCSTGLWSTPTYDSPVCLAIDTNQNWTINYDGSHVCAARKYAPTSKCCTVAGDCGTTGQLSPEPSTLVGMPPDCCGTCCDATTCCYSDQSYWTGTLPSVTYNGVNPAQQADIDWYNGAYAGTTATVPYSSCGCWNLTTAVSGGRNIVVGVGGGCGGGTVVALGISGTAGGYNFTDNGGTETCCAISGGTWTATDPVLTSVSGSVSFAIQNNHCCRDSGGTCIQSTGTCDGTCNSLP